MFDWLFGNKRAAKPPVESAEVTAVPPGVGWRQWFELSIPAAMDPPWNYEWVELWRQDWGTSRVTRSADLPYEMKGPGYWWRPWMNRSLESTVIDSGEAGLLLSARSDKSE